MGVKTNNMKGYKSYTQKQVNEENITFITVEETVESVIPFRGGSGHGVITHVGAYKRFKFQYDGKTWTTEPGNKHAIADDKSEAICMENIIISEEDLENLDKGWNTYINYLGKKPYFIEI